MPSRLMAVAFDAHDPEGLASFWGSLLDRQVVHEPNGALLTTDGTQVGLRFIAASTEKCGRNRLHVHLTSTSLADQLRIVAMALSLGARLVPGLGPGRGNCNPVARGR